MDIAAFCRLMWDQQVRAFEYAGRPLAVFTIWNPAVPDARLADPKKRGEFRSATHGSMSRMYCVFCHRPSPYAVSESMQKCSYVCLYCHLEGKRLNAPMVPGTALM
jgi:hypothetical protein